MSLLRSIEGDNMQNVTCYRAKLGTFPFPRVFVMFSVVPKLALPLANLQFPFTFGTWGSTTLLPYYSTFRKDYL